MEENYTGAHIIFTSRGDENNLPGGCYSYVGCQGAQGGKSGQIINLGRGCVNKGLLLHEILHALGNILAIIMWVLYISLLKELLMNKTGKIVIDMSKLLKKISGMVSIAISVRKSLTSMHVVLHTTTRASCTIRTRHLEGKYDPKIFFH